MKELKVVFLVLAIGFGSKLPVTPKFSPAYFPNTIKGGIQTTQKDQSATAAVVGVEGKYEYYLQYLKFKLDYQKKEEDPVDKKTIDLPACKPLEQIKSCSSGLA